jgi:hypothetical protein
MVFHQIPPVKPASRLGGQHRLEARANNIRDNAATLAISVYKWFGTSLPGFNPEKVPFYVAKLSGGGHGSTNFAERVIYPKV